MLRRVAGALAEVTSLATRIVSCSPPGSGGTGFVAGVLDRTLPFEVHLLS